MSVLWLHVIAVPAFGIAQGYGVGHSLLEGALLGGAALASRFAPGGQRVRSVAVCLGLLTSSGLLVHFSGGYIEFHFHFFVMIALLALYVDWFPFLLAVGYVLAHHGVVGVLDPEAVYNHPEAVAHPWRWAGIHASFILAAGAAIIFTWRISEEETLRRSNIERVTEAALAKLPLPELLDELLVRIAEVVQVDVATIWLRQDGGLELRAVHGSERTDGPVRLATSEGFYGRIVTERGAVVLSGFDPEASSNPIHRVCGVRSVAGVPLLVEGTLVGVLDVASIEPRQFSPADVDLLQLVADRVGPVIDRARLFEQEHQIAATLQRSLLPQRLPEVPGVDLVARYLPAGDHVSVGGDWYDVIELPRNRLALVMGDVAGHGSEAAALMGQLRTAVRAYAAEGHRPTDVVARVNTLLNDLDDDSMATLLYLELDLASWQGGLVNAGHPPPVLLDADGGCRLLEGSHAAPLGAVPYTAYPCDVVDVRPGATLVFYTDGLVERRHVPLQDALDGLVRRVADSTGRDAEALCAQLVTSALTEGSLTDDAAILTVQRDVGTAAATFDVEVPAEPAAIPAIRRRLEHWLRSAGARPDESYDIVTSACEACANAIQHAYAARDGVFQVTGAIADGRVEVSVIDSGRWREAPSTPDGGRGFMMMQALMDDVRVARSAAGTRVTLSRRLRPVEVGVGPV